MVEFSGRQVSLDLAFAPTKLPEEQNIAPDCVYELRS